jgi:transposase
MIAPLLPQRQVPGRPGRPREYPVREIVNAILYLLHTGCQWRNLPHDLPPYRLVFYYFRRWQEDGTLERVHDALRYQTRLQAQRASTPSLAVRDSQTVKTTEKGALAASMPPNA